MLVALQFWWNGAGGAPPPAGTAGIIAGRIPRSDGSPKSLQRILDKANPNKFAAREQRILKSFSQLKHSYVRAVGGNRLIDPDEAQSRSLREREDEEAIIRILSNL